MSDQNGAQIISLGARHRHPFPGVGIAGQPDGGGVHQTLGLLKHEDAHIVMDRAEGLKGLLDERRVIRPRDDMQGPDLRSVTAEKI